MSERPLLPLVGWRRVRRRRPGLVGEWVALGVLAALDLGFFWRVLLAGDAWLPRGRGDRSGVAVSGLVAPWR